MVRCLVCNSELKGRIICPECHFTNSRTLSASPEIRAMQLEMAEEYRSRHLRKGRAGVVQYAYEWTEGEETVRELEPKYIYFARIPEDAGREGIIWGPDEYDVILDEPEDVVVRSCIELNGKMQEKDVRIRVPGMRGRIRTGLKIGQDGTVQYAAGRDDQYGLSDPVSTV